MNQQIRTNPEWPLHIEPGPDGSRVVFSDGDSVDLNRFKDDCRRHAAELRHEAMDHAFWWAFAAAQQAWLSSLTFLRTALARIPAEKAHRA